MVSVVSSSTCSSSCTVRRGTGLSSSQLVEIVRDGEKLTEKHSDHRLLLQASAVRHGRFGQPDRDSPTGEMRTGNDTPGWHGLGQHNAARCQAPRHRFSRHASDGQRQIQEEINDRLRGTRDFEVMPTWYDRRLISSSAPHGRNACVPNLDLAGRGGGGGNKGQCERHGHPPIQVERAATYAAGRKQSWPVTSPPHSSGHGGCVARREAARRQGKPSWAATQSRDIALASPGAQDAGLSGCPWGDKPPEGTCRW